MKMKEKYTAQGVEYALGVVGPKWTVLVIRELLGGVRRFSELERCLKGISPRTLSLRLFALEKAGVIERQVYPEVPPRVEYKLTAKGKSLETLLRAMGEWGESHGKRRK